MGAQPLPSPYIYLRFGLPKTHENVSLLAQPYPSPSSSLVVLREALQENHKLHHHAVVLPELSINFSSPLAGSRRRRRPRAVRVLNTEVSSVRH